jgi:signal transduction histidine kinase
MTTALAAIRQGAYDYILKPFEPDDLLLSVQRALQQRALVDENKRLIQDLRSFNEHLEEIVRERTQALQRSEKKLVEYAHELESAHAQLLLSHEELQEAYRKLRDLDSLKAKFISITSHELRTPLTTIYGYASLAATQPLTAEKQAQALGAIERNVERLMAIVAEITDIAQLKEKRLYLRRVPLRLETLLPEVVDELRPLAEGRRQAVATSVEGTLPPILADRNRITQVLQQLLLNAIRFTPDGGSISVTARLLAGRQPQVQVSVADTGIGIDADKLATVFEEFYEAIPWQHHHTGTTEFGSAGLGLGLSVVQGIVEEHGGRIWAESARSTGRSGSTFHVVFPAQTGV